MDPSLYQAVSQLPAGDGRMAQLYRLAVSPGNPQTLEVRVRMGLALVAALLLASGLIFWVAANWQEQSRMFKLGLIEGALALAVLAACLWPRGRMAALFCATLVLGGLLAFVGQTYQTGADAWQLFATWAALSLVWAGLMRSDMLWALWVLIAALGIAMWSGRFDPWDVFLADGHQLHQLLMRTGLWLALALVPALVSLLRPVRVAGGMGWWSHRIALAFALLAWVGMGMVQLFSFMGRGSGVVLALVALLVAVSLLVSLWGHLQDFVSTCLAALAANVLVLSMVARWLWDGSEMGALLVFALVAMACLGGSVRGLMAVQQRMRAGSASAMEVV
ncbi:MAG: DUF2157 domain-containing protein [Comamonas sp.]